MWNRVQKEKLVKALVDMVMPADSPEHLKKSLEETYKKMPWSTFCGVCALQGVFVGGRSDVAKKLLKRAVRILEIANAIQTVKDEGLYDAAEHLTSEIDLEE